MNLEFGVLDKVEEDFEVVFVKNLEDLDIYYYCV